MTDKIAIIALTKAADATDGAQRDEQLAYELRRIFEEAERDSKWKIEKITVFDDP